MDTDIVLDDPALIERWFEAELVESAEYESMLADLRRAGKLVERRSPLAVKALRVLADLPAVELSQPDSLRRRALRALAELPDVEGI